MSILAGDRLVAGLVLLPTPASGTSLEAAARGGITIRVDHEDTAEVLDIYQVGTNQRDPRSFFGVSGYEFFQTYNLDAQIENYFEFVLDTNSGRRIDRFLGLYYWPPNKAYYCELQNRNREQLIVKWPRCTTVRRRSRTGRAQVQGAGVGDTGGNAGRLKREDPTSSAS